MTLTEALLWIANQGSQIFRVRFVKRTDNAVREMSCMLGTRVLRNLKFGQRAYDPTSEKLIWVYDVDKAKAGKQARRSIPTEGLLAIKIDGVWEPVTQI